MNTSVLSQPFNQTLRRINYEKIATVLLTVWCLLPLAMAVVCIVSGLTDGETLAVEPGVLSTNFLHTLSVYRTAFFALGFVTVVFALLQIGACWDSIKSRESLKRHPWFYLFAALLLWATISTFLADNLLVALHGNEYNADGLVSYFIFAAVFCCALGIKSEQSKVRLLRLFVAVVDILAVLMLLQAFDVYPFNVIFQSRYASVFIQFNHFGYMLCMASLCSAGLVLFDASQKVRVCCLVSFALLLFTLLVNDTFGCYLAVIVGLVALIVFWFVSGRRKVTGIVALLIVFVALTIVGCSGVLVPLRGSSLSNNLPQLFHDVVAVGTAADDSGRAGTGRMHLWIKALEMIPERPLFGYGPEGLLGAYQSLNGEALPHNELIQCAVTLGIPALLFYLAALVLLAVRQLRDLKALSPMTIVAAVIVVGYFTSSLFGCTMIHTMPYYWMALGFTACLADPEQALFKLPRIDEGADANAGVTDDNDDADDGADADSNADVADIAALDANIDAGLTANVDASINAAPEADASAPTPAPTESQLSRIAKLACFLVVVIVIGLLAYRGVEKSAEMGREACDLTAQEDAIAFVNIMLDNGDIEEPTEFWYDAARFTLSSYSDEAPEPCGAGTALDGGETTSSVSYYKNTYGYDTSLDYTDKAIHVTVDPNADEDDRIQIEWVPVS